MKKSIVLGLALVFITTGCAAKNSDGKLGLNLFNKNTISIEDAKTKAVDFINNNLVQPGNNVTIKEATEENGLYKLVVATANGQEVTSYLTKDGKTFFPQAMSIEEIEKQKQDSENQQANQEQPVDVANMPKQDKANVELFVMSHCPYGTQIEKGIVPVLETLGDKVDFTLKFCNYAMHGEKELKEQLNQYCIQKNEPKKLISYLKCFLEAGNGDDCITKTGINKSKLTSCTDATDKEFKVMAGFADKNTWLNGNYPKFEVYNADNEKYGVGGSPTLVINGKQANSGRDAQSLLTTICAGYNTAPEECSQTLSSDTPGAGFGNTVSSNDASGGCGS